MQIKPYKFAIQYLESLIPADIKRRKKGTLRLERIEHLLRLIGNPERSFRSIHIGGTSGKGSTAYITAAIFKEAGYKTGLHISPHLEKINERMQIFDPKEKEAIGRPASDYDIALLIDWVKPYVEEVGRENPFGTPSYFEVLVALSFEYFRRKKVEIAVVEVGLGGRFDATNVLRPEVAVITNVDLDHTELLGGTVEKIAREKAGIIKPGIEVITAATQKSVLDIIKNKCEKNKARLIVVGEDVKYKINSHTLKGLDISLKTNSNHYSLVANHLLGRHQAGNIACAIAAVESIKYKVSSIKVSELDVKRALKKIHVPGRLEIVSNKYLVPNTKYSILVFDGAHNPVKVRALATALKELFPKQKINFIFAAKKNKDVKAMIEELAPIASKFYLTRFLATTDFGKNQSTLPEEIAKFVPKNIPYIITDNAKSVLRGMRSEAKKLPSFAKATEGRQATFLRQGYGGQASRKVICVTGSLYLVGEARSIIKK